MRFVEDWARAIVDLDAAAALVVLSGGAFAGIAVLFGLPVLPAALVGFGFALVGVVAAAAWLAVSWLRSRHVRAPVAGDE